MKNRYTVLVWPLLLLLATIVNAQQSNIRIFSDWNSLSVDRTWRDGIIANVLHQGDLLRYKLDLSSAATIDSVTGGPGVVVDGPGGTGRWILQFTGPVAPEWWGASTDSGDDVEGLQAAIDYVEANGGSVQLSHGSYDIDTTLTINGKVYIQGVGPGSVIHSSVTGPAIHVNSGGGVLTENGALRDFRLEGDDVGEYGITCGQLHTSPLSCNNYDFTGLDITEFIKAGVHHVVSQENRWRACQIHRNRDGIRVSQNGGGSNTSTTHDGVHVRFNDRHGIFFDDGGWGYTIKECVVEFNGSGGIHAVRRVGSTASSTDCRVLNNHFESNYDDGTSAGVNSVIPAWSGSTEYEMGDTVENSGRTYVMHGSIDTVESVETDPTNTLTMTAHEFVDGDSVSIDSDTNDPPAGVSENVSYFVVGATADTVQLSASHSGTPILFTDAGSGTITLRNGETGTSAASGGPTTTIPGLLVVDGNVQWELVERSQLYARAAAGNWTWFVENNYFGSARTSEFGIMFNTSIVGVIKDNEESLLTYLGTDGGSSTCSLSIYSNETPSTMWLIGDYGTTDNADLTYRHWNAAKGRFDTYQQDEATNPAWQISEEGETVLEKLSTAAADLTPSVDGYTYVRTSGNGDAITIFDDAQVGQVIYVEVLAGDSLVDGTSNFKLSGGVDFAPVSGGTITLIYESSSAGWVQQGGALSF